MHPQTPPPAQWKSDAERRLEEIEQKMQEIMPDMPDIGI